MADSTEQLLLAFGIDMSPVKEAVKGITSMLDSLNDLAAQVETKTKATTSTAKSDAESLKASAQAAVLAAKQAIAEENAKAAAAKAAAAELKVQTVQHQANITASKEDVVAQQAKLTELKAQNQELRNQQIELRNQTAEINKQVAELRKKRVEAAAERKTEGGGGAEGEGGILGAIGGLGRKVTGGLLGSGLAGSVAGGLLAGGGIAMLIETAGEALEHFIDKLKELTVESGKLTILETVFQGLAKGAGIDATEMLQKMTEATEGLVSRTTLLKAANTELRSPLKLTQDQIVQLMGDVTKLSEAAGHTAEQGIDRLNMAFLRQRPVMLAMTLGVQGLRDVMRDIPPSMNAAQRTTLEWQRALKILHDQAEQMGELPVTLEQMQTRIHNTMQNIMLSFGQGFGESAGMQTFIRSIDEITKKFGGLEGVARAVGAALGDALGTISGLLGIAGENIKLVTGIVGDLLGILKDLGSVLIETIKPAFEGVNIETDATLEEFSKHHAVIGGLITAYTIFAKVLATVITPIKDLTGLFRNLTEEIKAGKASPDVMVDFAKRLPGVQNVDKLDAALKEYKDRMQRVQAGLASEETWATGQLAGGKTSPADQARVRTEANKKVDNLIEVQKDAMSRFKREMQAWMAQNHVTLDNITSLVNPEADLVRVKGNIDQQAKDFVEAFNKSAEDIQNALNRKISPYSPDTGESPQQKARHAAEDAQERQKRIAEEYQERQNALNERKQADDEAYRNEEEDMRTHYNNLRDIAKAGLESQLLQLEQNYASQKQLIEQQHAAGISDEHKYQDALKGLEDTTAKQRLSIHDKFRQQMKGILDQQTADEQAAARKRVESSTKASTDEIQARMEFNQKITTGGGGDIDSYYQKQLNYINQIKDAKVNEAWQLYALQKDSAAAQEQREAAIKAATDDAERKVQGLLESMASLRYQAVEKQFQPVQQLLGSQIQYGKEQAAAGLTGQPTGQVQDMIAAIQKYRDQLTSAANQMIAESINNGTQLNLNLWTQIVEKIEQSYETQQKWSAELENMQNILLPVANMFEQIGKTISGIWSAHTGDIGRSISAGAASIQTIQKSVYQAAGAFGIKTPETPIVKDSATLELEARARDLFDPLSQASKDTSGDFDKLRNTVGDLTGDMTALGTSVQQLSQYVARAFSGYLGPVSPVTTTAATGQPTTVQSGVESAGSSTSTGDEGGGGGGFSSVVQKWTSGIMSAVNAVGSFVDVINHAQSAISGAFGGAMGGGGLGQSIGSLFGGIGGPIGAIGGAALGGIIGGITGQKNEETQHNITELNQNYREIMQQFNDNTNNLQQAIVAMENLIAQAEVMQANSKKGGQQYAQLIQQYQQQLDSLQAQQVKIIRDMETQLAILQTPLAGQSYLNSIEDLLKQYQQFVGAAQNAQQLAQANQWLAASLQNLGTSYTQQLLQNEQQAVQDALQLNQLYQDRLNFINQLNNQIQGVLQQGSLTRQQTQAQKKGQQIEQIQAQANVQLDQMNQEIAVAQMKVDAESKVFSLATTRIGLETQLLQLQGAQTAYQMAQIEAMQQLVNTLSAGNYNFTTLQALLNALGFSGAAATVPPNTTTYTGGQQPSGYNLPPGFLPAPVAGTTQASPTADALTNLFASAYADRSSIGYGNYRGVNL